MQPQNGHAAAIPDASDNQASADLTARQYFKGIYPTGESAPEHETKLRLGDFAERPD